METTAMTQNPNMNSIKTMKNEHNGRNRKIVSKSLYTDYRKCRLLAWLKENAADEVKMSDKSRVTTDQGTEFGLLARGYFGDFTDVSAECGHDIQLMIQKTKEYIEKGVKNIAEATFKTEDSYCQIDILHKNDDDTYDIIEVKSSSKIKPYYIDDIAFQYHTINQCITLKHAYLLNVDTSYRLDREITNELFNLNDVTHEVKLLQDVIDTEMILNTVNSADEPEQKIGRHCQDGWECPFIDRCKKTLLNEEQRSFIEFEGMTWLQKIRSLENNRLMLPAAKQFLLMDDEKEIIDKAKIREFLGKIKYPLYMLDFESIQNLIPTYQGQKPWSQTPFQYSLHIIRSKEDLMGLVNIEHKECIVFGDSKTDPRHVVADSLVRDIPESDSMQIMAYNMSFEKSIIKELAFIFPEYAERLNTMLDKFIDLDEPFKKRYYYKGSMKGSYSIKTVLPTLFPDDSTLDYHSLDEVQNGIQAQIAYRKVQSMYKNSEPQDDIDSLRNNMLKYCELDTFAMVKILGQLYKMVE